MVNGRHGLSVLNRVMVVVSTVPDHTTVAWSMMLKLLCVVHLVLIQRGQLGQHVHYVTNLASHQFWRNDNAVKHARMSKICKKRHAWHHDVHIGLSGAAGEHVQYHVVMVLESDHEHVLDQPNSVPR